MTELKKEVKKEVKKSEETVKPTPSEPKFTKDQLMTAKEFAYQVDLVQAVLVDGIKYTVNEAKKLINNYLKGAVK